MIAWMPKERHPKGRSLDFFPSKGRSTNRVRFEANCDRFISCKPFHFQELKVILLANDETLFLCEHFLRICWSIKKIIIIIFNCHFHSAQKCIKTFKRTFTVIVIGKKKAPLGLSYVANDFLMVLRDVREIMWCDFLLASVMLQIVANDFLMVLRGAHEIVSCDFR